MHISCKSCGKEFNELTEGIRYSSMASGVMLFCSDDCCKDYLNVKRSDNHKYRISLSTSDIIVTNVL